MGDLKYENPAGRVFIISKTPGAGGLIYRGFPNPKDNFIQKSDTKKNLRDMVFVSLIWNG